MICFRCVECVNKSRHNSENFELFTLDDVDAAFDKIIQLKYNQSISLKGKGQGISVTPLAAGHMIGGTIWRIIKDGEEDIVYAVDFNHKKERHLNGCVLESVTRPSLLITDAYNAAYNQARRRQRDEQLMTNILQTLRNSGNVLIAVDTAGRVLELAHMLDQLWRNQDSGLMAYSLALLNNVSYNVVEFAKSQVEWMSDKIMRTFEGARNNPFQFKHLQLCHSLPELNRVPDPKVVLASSPDLECGFSRELFIQWCTNPRNSIILTNRTSPGTLGRQLIQNPNQCTVTILVKRRVRLEGAELEDYMRKEKEKELEAAKLKAEKGGDMEDSDSSEDSDIEMEVDIVGKAKHDLMMKTEGKSRGGGFFKQAKKSYPMFPVREEKIKWDDYGEIIRPEDFMILDINPTEDENKENREENDETLQDITEVPTKCVAVSQTLDINASVQFIDFEGRSDAESIKKIISMCKPRRLILVRGSPTAIDSLASYCQNSGLVQGKVFIPKLYEWVDATTESHIYQVKLKDSLVSSLNFARAKEAELAWVDGEIVMVEDEYLIDLEKEELKKEKEEVEEEETGSRELIPTLQPLPTSLVCGHPSMFINELKLSDFKQVLLRNGIQAEFSGGVLYCNSVVAIRKNEAGRINLEGCLCEDYYKVRDLLYEQYAII
ncbi:cleavage and polyadenylation specificity factor subunit 2-like isoform X2 [Limulus polyphemus]|uniref:Cleavage and polyadenylation specificity factor subunit 2 n=1 Tax=Limulus polyphemus TaxID=6850 RepID=A0ABM1SLW7_LIMPO|nr:cleavage and polyadenylation specificity factor subunit 2-like isoform X2 [Limulus polyphemus]